MSWATASSSTSGRRATMVTRTPLAASAVAVARPMPLEPPVITACRPARVLIATTLGPPRVSRAEAARGSAERAGGAELGDPRLVPAEHVGQHGVAVLADGRRHGGGRKLLTDELDRAGQHVDAVLRRGQPRHAVLELRVPRDRLGRVDRRQGGVVLLAEDDPLAGRPGLEDLGQLVAQLEVATGVVRVLAARVRFEQLGAADALAEVLPELALAGHED